jgi:hypothetical protein
VQGPGGKALNPTVTRSGSTFKLLAFDVNGGASVGDWIARAARLPRGQGDIAYHISAFSVEGQLSYRVSDSGRLGTGQPVVVRAEVGFNGKPLDHLPAGALKVTVERPGENMGNILHDSTVAGTATNQGGDTQDALTNKVEQLAASNQLLDRTAPKPQPNVLTLAEEGNGFYSGTFSDTVVGGQYRLRLDLDFTDSRTGGRIKRTEVLERQLPVAPDAQSSQIGPAQVNAGAGTATVQVVPRDRFGNFVGPGFGSGFTVSIAGGSPTTPASTDAANRGIYDLQLTGLPGGDPTVTIKFGDATLASAPLSQIGSGGGGGGCNPTQLPHWLIILILILILLVIIVIIRLRKKSGP